MRKLFQQMCAEWTQKDHNTIVLSGDFGFQAFEAVPKGQFLNFGPMEQAMVSVASGLAIGGKYPIVYAITPFIIERAFEQVKLDLVPYPSLIVTYSDYEGAGPTHDEINSRAMCNLLGIQYFDPKTINDCQGVLQFAYRKPTTIMVQLSQQFVDHERDAKGKLVYDGL